MFKKIMTATGAALVVCAMSASAATFVFNTANASGTSMTFNNTGSGNPTTLTARAYELTTTFSNVSGNAYNGGGLGLCSVNSDSYYSSGGTPTCSGGPEHQIDNYGTKITSRSFGGAISGEFYLLTFSSAVDSVTINLQNFGTCDTGEATAVAPCTGTQTVDTDVSYWLGTSSTSNSANGKNLGNLNTASFGSRIDNDTSSTSTTRSFTITSATTFRQILIGARVGNQDSLDYFKITSLTAADGGRPGDDGAVPEPSTYALIGSALVGLGLLRRKN